jgi:photosystem II stability/assembly factor-like uncharacterized protein
MPGNQVSGINALNNRIWAVVGGVNPLRSPEMVAMGKVSTDPSQTIGEATKVSAPDPNNFGKDIQIGTIDGETERAKFAISARFTSQEALLLKWKNNGCRVDIFVLTGKCGNPQDFTLGGEKWMYFPDGQISGHSLENYGAYGRDEDGATNEMVDMTSEEYYEFLYMRQDQIAAAASSRETYTIDVAPHNNCEDCATPGDDILITMAGAAATPGTKPVLLYSADYGDTFNSQSITTMFSNEEVVGSALIAGDFVIISNTSNSLHWTNVELLYDGVNTWSENINGFVASKGPRAIWSVDARHTWIVGDGGYVYFTSNHRTIVTVQDAGVATTQRLNSVHAFDNKNILAVGNSNAIVWSQNGGVTWDTVTGPAVGINLSAVWMWSADTWFVGEGAGGTGKLWVTINYGKTWQQIVLPFASIRIFKIEFISEAEGYIAAGDGSTAVILRTKTAGNEWVVLPDGKRAVAQLNTSLNDIAVVSKYANTVYACGLADNGSAGVVYKFAG